MFRFAHIDYLFLLLILPFLCILFLVARYLKKKAIRSFGDLNIISQLMPDVSYSRPVIKFIFIIIALTGIIFAMAGPQFGSKLEEVKRKGVEIVIALDVSNSMMAEDIQPNRLERAKQAISKLVDRLSNDKIGLIVFAGDAYTQIPITTDYASAKMFLSSITTEIVPKQGTAIGSAINLGMKSFSPSDELNKALIIITDGENHEDDAVEAAKKATGKGIIVHTLGIGLPKGSPIPVKGKYGQQNFKKDSKGNIVISKLNEIMLRKIASAGNGIYIRATNTRLGLNSLLDEINKMEKEEIESKVYSEYDEQFQYIIGIVLFFLFLEFILLERKNKLLQSINIFNVKN